MATITSVGTWVSDFIETVSTNEDTVLTGNVLDNAQTGSGSLRVNHFTVDGQTVLAGKTVSISGVGSIQVNENGSYTFTPAANYYGKVPAISYTVNNGVEQVTSALNIDVVQVKDPVSDGNEIVAAPQGSTVSGNVLDNAASAVATKVGSFYYVNGQAVSVGTEYAVDGVGTVKLNADGTYTVTTPASVAATDVTVNYTVTNGEVRDDSVLTVKVGADGKTALLSDQSEGMRFMAYQGNGNVLDNAASSDGTLKITTYTVNGVMYAAGQQADLGDMGTLKLNADGTYTINAARVINEGELMVHYTVANNSVSVESSLSVAVTPDWIDDVVDGLIYPVTDLGETVITTNPAGVDGNVLANAVSNNQAQPDAALSVTSFSVNGETHQAGTTAEMSGVGSISIAQDGSFHFAAADGFHGDVPTVSYMVTDQYATATSELHIVAPEDTQITIVNGGDNSAGKMSILTGGLGADVLIGDTVHSNVHAATGDVVNGASGDDVLFGDTINISHLSWTQNGVTVSGADYQNAVDGLRDYVSATLNQGEAASEQQISAYVHSNWLSLVDTQNQGGNDVVMGGAGNDTLIGGSGDDRLIGGSGNDSYVFTINSNSGHDTITGFTVGQDKIVFTDLTDKGQLVWQADTHTLSFTGLQDGVAYTNSIVINGAGTSTTLDELLAGQTGLVG